MSDGQLAVACFILTLFLLTVGFYHIIVWLTESREEDEYEEPPRTPEKGGKGFRDRA